MVPATTSHRGIDLFGIGLVPLLFLRFTGLLVQNFAGASAAIASHAPE